MLQVGRKQQQQQHWDTTQLLMPKNKVNIREMSPSMAYSNHPRKLALNDIVAWVAVGSTSQAVTTTSAMLAQSWSPYSHPNLLFKLVATKYHRHSEHKYQVTKPPESWWGGIYDCPFTQPVTDVNPVMENYILYVRLTKRITDDFPVIGTDQGWSCAYPRVDLGMRLKITNSW